MVWSNDKINTLGVDIGNGKHVRDKNISVVIAKMKTVAEMWYYRTMTLLGKVTVINSLMSSLFVYRMQVLPVLSNKQIDEVECIMS